MHVTIYFVKGGSREWEDVSDYHEGKRNVEFTWRSYREVHRIVVPMDQIQLIHVTQPSD